MPKYYFRLMSNVLLDVLKKNRSKTNSGLLNILSIIWFKNNKMMKMRNT